MRDFTKIKYFIYCSGKTGSTTLNKNFIKVFGKENVLHNHTPDYFNLRICNTKDIKDIILDNSKIHDKIYLIDSYREPIERAVASFFQNINSHVPKWSKKNIEEIIEIFNDKKFYFLDSYHSYFYFFDYLKLSTDINFDFEKGYTIINHKNFVLIKTRLKESYRWNTIFKEIFNVNFDFGFLNNSESKPYSEMYKNFKEKYELPKSLKEEFLETYNLSDELLDLTNPLHVNVKEMKKFMNEEEIVSYFDKWKIK